MTNRISSRSTLLAALFSIASIAPITAGATIVEIQTDMGSFKVNLYDNDTPATVANFLAYVNSGAYTNSVIHRSASNFVIQSGGYTFDTDLPLDEIPTTSPVTNEPVFSNVRGTIAMAKNASDPNSATSQWFINLTNNSANLDSQNSGFTAFGEVIFDDSVDGMDVVDAIAALRVFAFSAPFDNLPLQNYSIADYDNNVPVVEDNLVIVEMIVVADSTVDSAAGLNPPRNNANSGSSGSGGGGGGGALNTWATRMLLTLLLGRPVARRLAWKSS